MPKARVTGLLNGYFNSGEAKRPATDFLAELKQLTPAEKNELALGVAAIQGIAPEDVELLKAA